jgi:hypothetical protein
LKEEKTETGEVARRCIEQRRTDERARSVGRQHRALHAERPKQALARVAQIILFGGEGRAQETGND